jgi:hypothetical protein
MSLSTDERFRFGSASMADAAKADEALIPHLSDPRDTARVGCFTHDSDCSPHSRSGLLQVAVKHTSKKE